jgi:TadE-like protein
VVEFALVAPLAIVVAMAVAQFALFLYERNVVMGSLSEGARVAATSGRTTADGQRAAGKLLREALGRRIAETVPVRGAVESGLVVLRADATLPSFVPGLPGLEVHMTAAMHKEEDLRVLGEPRAAGSTGAAAATAAGADAATGAAAPAAAGPATAAGADEATGAATGVGADEVGG